MTPRTKVESDPVATATMERIRRSLEQRPQRKGLHWGVVVIALVAVFVWLAWPRGPSADPIGDGRLNNAQATPAPAVSVPAPRAELVRLNPNVPRATLVNLGTPVIPTKVQMGDTFWVQMPDSRWIVAAAMGRANRLEELPLTGNRIGDARWIGEHCFVWLNPIGQTNPTWIDP
jgi:hypothetical protein